MRINVYNLCSKLHEKKAIDDGHSFLDEIRTPEMSISEIDDVSFLYENADVSIIHVLSGGTEKLFLEIADKVKDPVYLLASGKNNSLAASLEILSYLNSTGRKGEIIHGSSKEAQNRIISLKQKRRRIGFIGGKSDWLISSDIDKTRLSSVFGIDIVEIPIERLISQYQAVLRSKIRFPEHGTFNEEEWHKAYALHKALEDIKAEENLSGLSVKCFDLLEPTKTTACWALALLNSEDSFQASCEGDLPSLIGMMIVEEITGKKSFQANPSLIKDDEIILAHCTVPLSMCTSHEYLTHFESDTGIAVRGKLPEEICTIFRIDANLRKFFLLAGRIEENMSDSSLCRTQIRVKAEGISKLLTHPLGNHELVILGDERTKIKAYLESLGLEDISDK